MTTEQALEITEQISKNLDNGYETAIVDLKNDGYFKFASFLSVNDIEMIFPETVKLVIWNNKNNYLDRVIEGLTEIDIYKIDMLRKSGKADKLINKLK